MKYALDILYNIYMLLPPVLRKPSLFYFIVALLSPVKSLHEQFLDLRTDANYWQKFTGQILFIEYLLKEQFNGYTITIGEGVSTSSSYIGHIPYSNFAIASLSVGSTIISHIGFDDELQVANDFTVNVPAQLFDSMTQTDFDKMRAIVDRYKLFGKKYEIIRV